MEDIIYNYVHGKFRKYCDYAQKIVEDKYIDDADRKVLNETVILLNCIRDCRNSLELYRSEILENSNDIPKIGDTYKWGIRSFSLDRDFISSTFGNVDYYINKSGNKVQANIEYVIRGESNSLCAYKYLPDNDKFRYQKEYLVTGKYKVTNVYYLDMENNYKQFKYNMNEMSKQEFCKQYNFESDIFLKGEDSQKSTLEAIKQRKVKAIKDTKIYTRIPSTVDMYYYFKWDISKLSRWVVVLTYNDWF